MIRRTIQDSIKMIPFKGKAIVISGPRQVCAAMKSNGRKNG